MPGTFRRSHGLQALLLLVALAAPVVAGPYWVHVGALAYTQAFGALLLILVLLVRPTGLFGRAHMRLE